MRQPDELVPIDVEEDHAGLDTLPSGRAVVPDRVDDDAVAVLAERHAELDSPDDQRHRAKGQRDDADTHGDVVPDPLAHGPDSTKGLTREMSGNTLNAVHGCRV